MSIDPGWHTLSNLNGTQILLRITKFSNGLYRKPEIVWHTYEWLSMQDLIFLIVEMMESKMFQLKAKYY